MYCVPTSARLTTPWQGAPRPLTLDPPMRRRSTLATAQQRGPLAGRGETGSRMRPRGFGGGPAVRPDRLSKLDFATPARGLATTVTSLGGAYICTVG